MTAPASQHDDAKAEDVLDRGDARWLRLQEIIRAYSLKRGEFVLASGRTSTYLFQLRQTTMLPEGAALIADIIVDYMKRHAIACIGGLELGAVPIVSAVAAVSHLKGYPVDAFFVRKAQKEHGARERVDGFLRADAEVLMIDDVATTGGSILKAIEGMEGQTAHVRRALAVVDREEGAAQNLAVQGIKLVGAGDQAWRTRQQRGPRLPPKNQNTTRRFFSTLPGKARTNGTNGGAIRSMKACP
jgi:orotate phosphoribosyltransferase